MNSAFGARRTDQHAVARVVLALFRPLILLALALPHEPPILGEIRTRPVCRSDPFASCAIGFNSLDDRIVEAGLRELNQKWAGRRGSEPALRLTHRA